MSEVSEEERQHRIAEAVLTDIVGSTLDQVDQTLPLWYLSFVDPELAASIPEAEQRAGGPSWLGGCFVPALAAPSAAAASHRLGCNPGGEVAIYGPIPREAVRPDYIGRRLTTPEELEAAHADAPEGTRFCPECGCTDARACDGGCTWVAGSALCSACFYKEPSA